MRTKAPKLVAVAAVETPPPPPAHPTPDVGDRVYVAVWRETPQQRVGEPAGAWTVAYGRVVGTRRDGTAVSYETEANTPAESDAPLRSQIRFARADHVFSDPVAANEACRTLPPPTNP